MARTKVLQESRPTRVGPLNLVLAGREAPLRGPHRLQLRVSHTVDVRQQSVRPARWVAHTVGYIYELILPDGRTLLGYHWHPVERSAIRWPHLHSRSPTQPVDLSRVHLPSGVLQLDAVLRCAIAELGVEPLRADWERVLAAAEASPEPGA